MEHGLMSMPALLQALYDKGASDLHVKVGRPPMMRLRGELVPVEGAKAMDAENDEFGEHRLIETLWANRTREPGKVLLALVHAVQQFSGGEQSDDLTLVVARGR